jgi:DNA-binding transcriptional LysR family regulator
VAPLSTSSNRQWYQRVLPEHRVVAHCRTYEVALELVRAGCGVRLVPGLTALQVFGSLDGIDLYETDHGDYRNHRRQCRRAC